MLQQSDWIWQNNTFSVCARNAHGKVLFRKTLPRDKLFAFMAQQLPCWPKPMRFNQRPNSRMQPRQRQKAKWFHSPLAGGVYIWPVRLIWQLHIQGCP